MAAKLIIKSGNAGAQVFELSPGTSVKLGRSKENQVVLRDEHVSRVHAEIYQQSGMWIVRDAGGRNGTRVNSQVISEPTALEPDSLITVGKTSIRFTVEPDTKPTLPLSSLSGLRRHLRMPEGSDASETVLQLDELSALLGFMVSYA